MTRLTCEFSGDIFSEDQFAVVLYYCQEIESNRLLSY